MSKKRGFAQIGGLRLFPASKRRKICHMDTENTLQHEQKETEFAQNSLMMDMDDESIASVVESIDSLESDTSQWINNHKENENECADLLYKLQFNPNIIVATHHFTQNICILGGNHNSLISVLPQITKSLIQIIDEYNFKLHAIHKMDYNVNKNENKLNLINTMVAAQLLQNRNFNKVLLDHNHTATNCNKRVATYEQCDICLVFPDNNLHILCELITYMNSTKTADNNDGSHRLNTMEPYTKRILLINVGGFFNGLRLQMMNFSANDSPQPVNIVFVDEFNGAIVQLKEWSL